MLKIPLRSASDRNSEASSGRPMNTASIVAISLLFLFRKYKDTTLVQSIVLTLKCMALALIVSTMVKLGMNAVMPEGSTVEAVRTAYVMAVMCAAFYLMHWKKLSPLPVMLGCGALNVVVAMLGM